MLVRILNLAVFVGVFAIGCKLIAIGYTLLGDFAAQNFDIADEAYGFFAVFVVSGFLFFWGLVLTLSSGIVLLFLSVKFAQKKKQ